MLMSFSEDSVETFQYRDGWGYPRTLTSVEKEGVRIGLRFIRRCYYALVILLVISVCMIAYLSFAP